MCRDVQLWDTLVRTAALWAESPDSPHGRQLSVNENLQRLLAALAAGDADAFAAALSEITDLPGLDAEIVEFSDSITSKTTYTADDVRDIGLLADVVEKVRAEMSSRTAADQSIAEQVAAAFGRISPPAAEEATEEVETEDEVVEEVAPEPVLAAAKPAATALLSRLAASRNRAAERELPEPDRNFLIAAADVPGIATGAVYRDWDEVAEAAERRWRSFGPTVRAGGAPPRAGLAVIQRKFAAELTANDEHDSFNVIERAASERRLSGGSLLAAGGWCAPSETLYDVCEMESATGLLDVPEINAARGGVRHSTGPDFSTIYAAVGFNLTEAQAIADTTKTCFEVPCPSFTDVRLNAIGVCITAGILQNAGYPEFVARYIRGSLVAHAHKVNNFRLEAMITGSTPVNLTAVGYFSAQGVASGLLEAAELQIEDAKHKNRLPVEATLEVVLPLWSKAMIRSDISKRPGFNGLDITDDVIRAYFAARRARVQFVYDFQDAFVDSGTGLGGASPATLWPTTVQMLIYPAGTWVAATKDVITLDAGIYDSVNITTNKYTALFTETGEAMLKRCTDSRFVTLTVCASGETAAQVDMDCTP